MADPRFEFYMERPGNLPDEAEHPPEHRWRLLAGNGEIIASGEGYTTAADAKRGAGAVISTVLELASKATHTIGEEA